MPGNVARGSALGALWGRAVPCLLPALAFSTVLATAGVLPRVDLPKDSPVSLLSSDPSGSVESVRGGASVVDVRVALILRNSGQQRIRGITMVVLAQDVTPGGKASVTVPSLNVAPGETFPVHVDLRLLRPVQPGDAVVQIGLDGVLFDDLAFYGPNHLDSRKALMVYELEARRDRRYLRALLDAGGPVRLQQEMLAAMSRRADTPGIEVQMVHGRPSNVDPERPVQFAFVEFPDAPVGSPGGVAQVRGNEAVAPSIPVYNRSDREIRSVEIGWILHDQQGRDFLAGSVPSSVQLAPGEKREMPQDAVLRFSSHTGQPMSITGMTGFVSNVEFADGHVWIPSRAELDNPRLSRALAPSPEQDRLLQIYRRKGLKALVEELKKS
jgi:hypothetical protein